MTTAAGPARGRPRSASVDAAIGTATLELLGEVGVARLSMDDVAARAGVSKASIYRRWPSKEVMILDVLNRALSPFDDFDTGSFVGDLDAYLGELRRRFRLGKVRDVIPYLIEAANHDDGVRAALDQYVANRRQPLAAIIERGVARAEIDPKFGTATEQAVLIDLITGPFMYRRLLSGDVIDEDYAASITALVLRAAAVDT